MNIFIKNITLEVTRRCNLKCRHCMRGNSQNKDINYKYIDYILQNNHSIGRLFFSGGEPLLNINTIIYTINKIINEKLIVLSIGFNTNGTIFNESLINILLEYRKYCFDTFPNIYNEKKKINPIHITFSNDQFHDYEKNVIEKYKQFEDKISYKETGNLDILEDEIILSGRAKNLVFGKYFEFENKSLNIEKFNNNNYILDNYFYITVNGDITTQGDGSYLDMDSNNLGKLDSYSFYNFIKDYYTETENKTYKLNKKRK